MTGNASIQANFAISDISAQCKCKSGGNVYNTSSPIIVNHGIATQLAATENDGYTFDRWIVTSGSEHATIESPTNRTTTITLTGNATVVASTITHSLFQLTDLVV